MQNLSGEAHDLTLLLNSGFAGDRSAADRAFEFVYDRLRAIATGGGKGRGPAGGAQDQTLHATALVHEVYAKLFRGVSVPWNDRTHFFSVAARAMRQIAIDHARASLAAKRGGGWGRVIGGDPQAPTGMDPIDMLALDEALEELATLNERQARIVELRFFAGLPVPEVAEILGCSPRTVQLDWRTARAWLSDRLGDVPE